MQKYFRLCPITVLRKSRFAQALAFMLSGALNPEFSWACGSGRLNGPNKKKNEDISDFVQLDAPPEGLEALLGAFKSSLEV